MEQSNDFQFERDGFTVAKNLYTVQEMNDWKQRIKEKMIAEG